MATKKIASKRGCLSAFDPIPEPPPAPPTQHHCANRHGEAALSFLLFITLIVFVAVSTGLSIFNTIEISRIRHVVTSESLKLSGSEQTAKTTSETTEYGSPEQMMQKADDLMQQAETMIQAQIDADGGSVTTVTTTIKK